MVRHFFIKAKAHSICILYQQFKLQESMNTIMFEKQTTEMFHNSKHFNNEMTIQQPKKMVFQDCIYLVKNLCISSLLKRQTFTGIL